MDRWVVPPAVAAAVFTVMAVAPPVGGPDARRGVRVEMVGRAVPGRALLVRAVLDDPALGGWHPLRGATLRVHDRSGQQTDAVRVSGQPGTPWAAATLRLGSAGPWTLSVEGPNTRVTCTVPEESPPPRVRVAESGDGALRVPVGTVLPGVSTEVLLRAEGAVRAALRPGLEGATVRPEEAAVDACGIAVFTVTAESLGLPVRVSVTDGSGAVRSVERRLPMDPGAAQLHLEDGRLWAHTAAADGVVWAVWGDPAGATGWSVVTLTETEAGGPGRAALAAPPDAAWVALARGGDLRGAVMVPRGTEGTGCRTTAAGRQWAAGDAFVPTVDGPRLLVDGGAEARVRAADAVRRVRRLASLGLALAVLAEAALVLGAGLRRDPISLRAIVTPRRERIGWALALGLALFTMAATLLLTSSIAGGR